MTRVIINKMIRTTQDDARENAQIELFELTPLQGRSNKYIPDATLIVDGIEHMVELKTSDVVKKQVSTARNVTLPKLDEYRKVHWIFSQYQKTEDGFEFTGEIRTAKGVWSELAKSSALATGELQTECSSAIMLRQRLTKTQHTQNARACGINLTRSRRSFFSCLLSRFHSHPSLKLIRRLFSIDFSSLFATVFEVICSLLKNSCDY